MQTIEQDYSKKIALNPQHLHIQRTPHEEGFLLSKQSIKTKGLSLLAHDF